MERSLGTGSECCWGIYLEEIRWFFNDPSGVFGLAADEIYGFFFLVDAVVQLRDRVLDLTKNTDGIEQVAIRLPVGHTDSAVASSLGELFPRFAQQKQRLSSEAQVAPSERFAVVYSEQLEDGDFRILLRIGGEDDFGEWATDVIDAPPLHQYSSHQITGRVYPQASQSLEGPLVEVVYFTEDDYPRSWCRVIQKTWDGKTKGRRLVDEKDRRLNSAVACPLMVFVRDLEGFGDVGELLRRLVIFSRGKNACLDVFPCPWLLPPTESKPSMVSHGTTGGMVDKANIQAMLKAREAAVRMPSTKLAASAKQNAIEVQGFIDRHCTEPVGRQALLRNYWQDLDDFDLMPDFDFHPADTLGIAEATEVPLASLCFSQDTISDHFRNGKGLFEVLSELRVRPELLESIPPISVVRFEGRLYSMDNRRLWLFRRLPGSATRMVPVCLFASPSEFNRSVNHHPRRVFAAKMTTKCEGHTIKVGKHPRFSGAE